MVTMALAHAVIHDPSEVSSPGGVMATLSQSFAWLIAGVEAKTAPLRPARDLGDGQCVMLHGQWFARGAPINHIEQGLR